MAKFILATIKSGSTDKLIMRCTFVYLYMSISIWRYIIFHNAKME